MRVAPYILFFSSLLCVTHVVGQNDFAELSPRERVAIAEQEEIEAKQDAAFQELMRQGHELFRERHYLKAIHRYEEAKKQRPYNVYPPVIIADIELSMKDTLDLLREKEREELANKTASQPKLQPQPKQEEQADTQKENEWTETKKERIEKINDWERQERIKLKNAREREEPKPTESIAVDNPEIKVLSTADMQEQLAREYPEGISEHKYSEGNKVITERVVVKGDTGNRYKRVVHSWGGVFYFKNGNPVAERVWTSDTE